MKYTYTCVKCKDSFQNDHGPADYRMATGHGARCCGEAMQLRVNKEVQGGDDCGLVET